MSQDHPTKFCVLRAPSAKRAAEVVFQLANNFLLLGAPAIIQCNNRSQFTSHVIIQLKEGWPEQKLVSGEPRHPQSQGSVERAGGDNDTEDMLVAWLADNIQHTAHVQLVQFQNNVAHLSRINRNPYSTMYSCVVRHRLGLLSLPYSLASTGGRGHGSTHQCLHANLQPWTARCGDRYDPQLVKRSSE